MPEPVERYEPDGIDYAWVMQVTFVITILLGAPIVALASTGASLPTWGERLRFALAIGSIIWFVTGLAVFGYARRYR